MPGGVWSAVTIASRIVSASEAGGLLRLETMALKIFGRGDRPKGWFERKLRRECVDAALSRLAVSKGGASDDPAAWLGYVLIGAPPSLAPRLRTAGTGVIPKARNAGVGSQLVSAAARVAARAGASALQIPAEDSAEAYYDRLGFTGRRRVATLFAFGRGTQTPMRFGDPRPWTPSGFAQGATAQPSLRSIEGATREFWTLTDGASRTTIDLGAGVAHATLEGVAVVLHRVLIRGESDAADAVDGIRDRIAARTPLLLTGVNTSPRDKADAELFRSLLHRGWSVAQRSVLMERTLGAFTAAGAP